MIVSFADPLTEITASDPLNPRSPLYGVNIESGDEWHIVQAIADVYYAGYEPTDEQLLRTRVILRAVVQHAQGVCLLRAEPDAVTREA
jgi:hypothetical protein